MRASVSVMLAVLWAIWCLNARGAETVRYLDNGEVRVGIDLALGGTITYLSMSGTSKNIINSHDPGREAQQSYYSGPADFGFWSDQPWPWNPVGAGDQWGNRSEVVEFLASEDSLYTKTIPLQWGGRDTAGTPCDCLFESWIRLEGNVVIVRNRLTNARSDRSFYGVFYQELPAVYTTGALHHVWTYDGLDPWTRGSLREVPTEWPPTYWPATESWAALTDDQGWGLGVYHPGVTLFGGGFYPFVDENTTQGGPTGDPTGYLSPLRAEILDWNIVYEFTYYLILGSLPEIRDSVYAHRPAGSPQWVFDTSRAHWWYYNASDPGWPIVGRLQVDVGELDPQLIGPECAFKADEVPWLYISAAHHVTDPAPGDDVGQVFFELDNGAKPFSQEQSIPVNTINDGEFHIYALDMRSIPSYKGLVTRLRYDPIGNGRPGDWVEIQWISSRPLFQGPRQPAGRISPAVQPR